MAVQKLGHSFDVEVKEFIAATVFENEEYVMRWIIGCNKEIDANRAAEVVDEELCNNNKNYKVARTKALKRLAVEVVPVEQFYSWSEEYKKLGGQAKIPRVMKEEDFYEFRNYVLQLV